MSDELSDLRVAACSSRCVHGMHAEHEWRTVTASEAASACPTEVLIAVLIERGVLRLQEQVVRWEPDAGGVS